MFIIATVLAEHDSSPVVVRPQNISQSALAKAIIQNKDVIHVPEIECFIAKGSKYTHHAVTLFPKQTCQRSSTSQCPHNCCGQCYQQKSVHLCI